MTEIDIPRPPADAIELLSDPRVSGLRYRGPHMPEAGVVLKPSDPPAVGESPYVLLRERYEHSSPAKVTWVNRPGGLISVLHTGSGKGFSRLTQTPRFEEQRPRPAELPDAWIYSGWLVASPKFAQIVSAFTPDVATMPVDWEFTDGKKLDGYVFLDVLALMHGYDYRRSEVVVQINDKGPYVAALGYPRGLRRELAGKPALFRDAYWRHDILVSRELARALLAADLHGFDFEDPAQQGPAMP